MTKWFLALAQTTTYLGVAVIAIIWGGIYLLANQEHDRAYQDAVRQGSNLARVLEQYIRRVIEESDGDLLALRQHYQENPQTFDIARWLGRPRSNTDLTLQFGIANSDGYVIQSSHGPLSAPIYVGDHAHFKFHVENTTDQLYISDPVVGQISGKLVIEFTPRRNNPDGSFAGTVATSLDVLQLEKFFSSLDIGKDGIVSLIGLDGVVRARGGSSPDSQRFAGITATDSPLFRAIRHATDGSYWNTAASSAKFDGVRRLISYRVISDLPLIAIVGLAENSIFQGARIQHCKNTL